MYRHGGDIYTTPNVIDFSANINPFGMPDTVRRAAQRAVSDAVHYPDPQAGALKAAIARMEGIDPEWLFCGNGAADVIFSLMLAIKPKKALVPVPSFYAYEQAIEAVGCPWEAYALSADTGFCLDETLLSAITPEVDLVMLCNPNNPTGVLTKRELLEKILLRCEETNTLLVVDECFLDLTLFSDEDTMLPYIRGSKSLFLIKAFTKTFAMPGLRLGYGISSNRKLLDALERVSQPWRVSAPAEAAGIAAAKLVCGHMPDDLRLSDGEWQMDYLDQSRRMIARQRQLLIRILRENGFTVYDSAANFVFFYDGKWRERTQPLNRSLLKKGILIRDCANFLGLSKGYYRVAVRRPEDNQLLINQLRRG